MEVCPVGNEHIPDIVDMRRYLTMSLGEVGHGGQKALKAMDRKRNPWGMSPKDREVWPKNWTRRSRNGTARLRVNIFTGLAVLARMTIGRKVTRWSLD